MTRTLRRTAGVFAPRSAQGLRQIQPAFINRTAHDAGVRLHVDQSINIFECRHATGSNHRYLRGALHLFELFKVRTASMPSLAISV